MAHHLSEAADSVLSPGITMACGARQVEQKKLTTSSLASN